jgi:5-methylcytosine-specific restriction endonuclease McrA
MGFFYESPPMSKKDAYYFSHDSNAQDDPKCMVLIDQMGMEGYGIFWALIEKLRAEKDYKLPLIVCSAFAKRWGTSKEKVETVIKNYGLFIAEDGFFFSERLMHSMNIRQYKARISAGYRWGNQSVVENSPDFQYSTTRSQRMSEARKRGTHKKAEWEEMRKWFGECVKCGAKEDIVKDHIVPIYQGGDDTLGNIQPLCRKCNGSKGRDNQDYRILFSKKNACEMPAAWLRMPANKEKESKEKENKKKVLGVSFDEKGENVFFADGTSQALGQYQTIRFKEGNYQPHFLKKGIIE